MLSCPMLTIRVAKILIKFGVVNSHVAISIQFNAHAMHAERQFEQVTDAKSMRPWTCSWQRTPMDEQPAMILLPAAHRVPRTYLVTTSLMEGVLFVARHRARKGAQFDARQVFEVN